LSVVVSRRSAGLVTVRILDSGKKEVRLLYAGMLQPGDWTFEWEGLLEDGSRAVPGAYFVETQSGSAVMQKKIQIEAE
jgi:flagellar hook assembly protein FlgD